jgi:hypothetical protein
MALQNFIYKYNVQLKNVQKNKKKDEGEVIRCQFKLNVKIFWYQKSIACNRSAVFLYVKNRSLTNRLAMVMGDVLWRDGSWEIAKPTSTNWLKMKDAYFLWNVIKTFWWRKVTKKNTNIFLVNICFPKKMCIPYL